MSFCGTIFTGCGCLFISLPSLQGSWSMSNLLLAAQQPLCWRLLPLEIPDFSWLQTPHKNIHWTTLSWKGKWAERARVLWNQPIDQSPVWSEKPLPNLSLRSQGTLVIFKLYKLETTKEEQSEIKHVWITSNNQTPYRPQLLQY